MALLLPTLYARTAPSQTKLSFTFVPAPFPSSFALQLATVTADAVVAEPRAATPRTPAIETRTAIRRLPRQPRSDRDELIT
jgi:hypothetical protein